ncbi:hypothetical protein ACH5RR_040178 [Cinchona calisaya]|uniref:Uncharacterized protein n=1 Tax=Cinchona calisaya TaxID=153742 RepID=A0ABD2XSK0_9GENT
MDAVIVNQKGHESRIIGLEKKIDSSNSEMKSFIAAMINQFNNLCKSLNFEKGIMGNPLGSVDRNSPMNRLKVSLGGEVTQSYKSSKYPGLPKIEFPSFNGVNPQECVRKCEKCF